MVKLTAALGKARCFCVQVDESSRIRFEGVLYGYHEDHIAAKGVNSLSRYKLLHKFMPMPHASKKSGCEGWSCKRMRKFEKIPAWQLTKVINKERGWLMMQERRAQKFILSHWWNMSFKECWILDKAPKIQSRVVFRGDIVKDDSGSYAVFTEQVSSASQMTAAKIMDIISRLPGCDGELVFHPCVNLHQQRWPRLQLNCVKLRSVSSTSNLLVYMFGFQ